VLVAVPDPHVTANVVEVGAGEERTVAPDSVGKFASTVPCGERLTVSPATSPCAADVVIVAVVPVRLMLPEVIPSTKLTRFTSNSVPAD
jgi:hypothetical protein